MGRDAAPLVPLTDDQRAMVEQNLGLVGHTLKVYFGQLCGDEDAWNDGVIGLARATRNYDPNRSSFSTYAINWIRSEIGNGIGRLAGLNARNAHRRGVDYEPPMSLDVVLNDEDGTSLDSLADPDADPSNAACDRAQLAAVAATLSSAARDELDRDIARRLTAMALGLQAETRQTIADRHGCTSALVYYRSKRLTGLLRTHLSEAS